MASIPPRCNLERKTRCGDLAAAAEALARLGARPAGSEEQTDTYFIVPSGRLKLRVRSGGEAALIWYDRPSVRAVRASRYYLAVTSGPEEMEAALAAALGVRGRVRKRRALWQWHNVRIHLDAVEGLGSFVEFEAVLSAEAPEAESRKRLEQLGAALGLQAQGDEPGSYADLLGL